MRALAARGEQPTVEFKGHRADVDEIVSAVVCFANGDGGLILWGVTKNGALEGSTFRDAEVLRNRIFSATSPSQVVITQAVQVAHDGTTVQVIGVWAEHSERLVSTTGGSYTQRLGLECVPMTPDRIVVRQIDTHVLDASAAVTPLTHEALDETEIQRFRQQLPDDGAGPGLRSLTDHDLLLSVGALDAYGESELVTVAGLLVFGRQEALRSILPQHELIYLRLQAGGTEYERRSATSAPLLKLIEQIQLEVQAASRIRTLRLGPRDVEVPDYPQRVLREAIVNSVAHRHLTLPGHVSIRQTGTALDLENPGGFPEGITPETVIQHSPVHRNKRLCEILDRVRYMERSGLGVDRIFEDQLRFGKLPPVYTADSAAVRLRLDAGTFDEPLARLILAEEERGKSWRVEELLVLSYLRRMGPSDRSTLARVVQRSEEEAQDLISSMMGQSVDRFGSGLGTRFALTARIQAALGAEVAYTRERGLNRAYQRSIVLQHATEFGRIDNATVRKLLEISVTEASDLLRSIEGRGELSQIGSRRWAYYKPVRKRASKSN